MYYFFGIFFVSILSLIFYKNLKKKQPELHEPDVETLLRNWHPKPLIDPKPEVDNQEITSLVAESQVGKWVQLNGKQALNFTTHNYLNLIENDYVKQKAKDTIFKYGVGSCGPRGFYGTVDIHLELESRLAKFTENESAIVYAYGFSTIASAIPAYVKKFDIVFADEKVNFAIQRGIETSRCKIFYFKHNDSSDLERLIRLYEANEKASKTLKSVRRFLIVEGIYINTGTICSLPELIEIRKKYKLRMFVDESISFGVLGKRGSGILEHYGIPNEDVDMIMASMEYALGTGGGFCVGSTFIVEHQRLSGLGYCFSASLPPFLAAAACAGIDIIEKEPNLIAKLSHCCRTMHEHLSDSDVIRKAYDYQSDCLSPVKHLVPKTLNKVGESYDEKITFLKKIVDHCQHRGYLITTAHYLLEKEHNSPSPSLRLTVNAGLHDNEIFEMVKNLEEVTEMVLNN